MLMNANEYLKTVEQIKQEIRTAQYRATVQVNCELLRLYHAIGTVINAHKVWGSRFVENLAADIERTGFPPRNMRRMRDFYRIYENDQMLLRLAMNIGWTLNVVIMDAELTRAQRKSCPQIAKAVKISKKELLGIISNGDLAWEPIDASAEICYNITKYNYLSANRTGRILRQFRPTGRCHKWRNSKMDVMDAGFGCIVDIGVAAAKKRFNLKLDEKKAHAILPDYLGS